MHRRDAAAPVFLQLLETNRAVMEIFSPSLEKNMEKCKNFVCILEKMGYNKV